ncbi:NACHT domain-containing protein [Salinactinospora qingdaonensis]|uniref:NACHT N-terminal Helical domain-containing protein n=1 Tax=Salinactinospora qingdaonensis TaxID=702744 RepID=A0ABP7FP79_9ACTN
MAKTLSYSDALKILGAYDGPVATAVDTVTGSAAELAGLPGLGTLAEEVTAKGTTAVRALGERINGVSRLERTERVQAAHTIITVVSFFRALAEVVADSGCPVQLDELGITAQEQAALATGQVVPDGYGHLIETLLASGAPAPSAARSYETNRADIRDSYEGLFRQTRRFLKGLARGRELVAHLPAGGSEAVVERAMANYDTAFRELVTQAPEFATWFGIVDGQATRHTVVNATAALERRVAELSTGLSGLESLLGEISVGRRARHWHADLAAHHRAALERPLLAGSDLSRGFTLPTLGKAYLNPRGRIAEMDGERSFPSADSWWQRLPVHEELQHTIVGLLTSVEATRTPLVVLGHPGAGKSKLTEVLAARLPAEDFLAVRVELRSVPADAPIQQQIEQGVYNAIGERVTWPELARSAEGALPVVMLDGFDELLQATGVNRSDYLEQVSEFQERQAELGRPVVVLVTSRTVVADRVRFPAGTAVVKLEPLSQSQIQQLLRIWNHANSAALARRQTLPMPLERLLGYRELAEQPLLLVMLLLFDAEDNALQRVDAELSRAELYERLLSEFTRREVSKHAAHLSGAELTEAVEAELRRLEVTAMAMFARRSQTVTADELNRDLAVLSPATTTGTGQAGLQGALSDADQVLGRFFFVHESRGLQEGPRSAYEFLHATFGEFLVARMVTEALRELVADWRHARGRRYTEPLNDGLLYALTSFTTLSGRSAALEFTDDLLAAWFKRSPADRADCRALLLDLFHEALYPNPHRSFAGYEPRRLPVTVRQGVYLANLVLLLTRVDSEPIDVAELFPTAERSWPQWRGLAGLWRALSGEEWHGTLDAVRVRHIGYGIGRGEAARTVVTRESGSRVNVGECVGFELSAEVSLKLDINDPYAITVPYDSVTSKLLRSMAMRANGTGSRMVLMLLPYLSHVSDDLSRWFVDVIHGVEPEEELGGAVARNEDVAWAEAHDVLELRLGAPGSDNQGRLRRYGRLLGHSRALGRVELLTLRQAGEDLEAVPWEAGGHEQLRTIVADFLDRVDTVVAAPRLAPTFVIPVLDRLRPYIRRSETWDRVRELVTATETDSAAETPPHTGISARQMGQHS